LAASTLTFVIQGQALQRNEVGLELTLARQGGRGAVDVEGTLLLTRGGATVRAIIAVPQWGLGTAVYKDPAWRQLANDLHVGILRLAIRNHAGPEDPLTLPTAEQAVRNASIGGAEAVLTLLNDFARETGRSELREARLLFWGHSAAGSFGTTFAAMHPTRTIAFVRYHSHSRGLPVDMSTIARIPALIFAGGKDTTAGVEDSETLWKAGRGLDAPWTFALEPDATHGSAEALRKANDLAIPWVRAVIDQRVSVDGKDLRTPVGTLGFGQSVANVKAGWLPDEASARGWRVVTGARQ
jgi:hypothetical protein